MYVCRSGKHYWTQPEDAARCCAPGWVRVLVVAEPGRPLPADAANVGTAGGTLYGRVWARTEANEGDPCEPS